jgi:hypothetical protein
MDTKQPEYEMQTENEVDDVEILVDEDGDIVNESDFATPVALADAASEISSDLLLTTASDRAANSNAVELYGLVAEADPTADVSAEIAALSDDDKERLESLREMAQSEGLTFSDSQLLALLHRVAQMNDMSAAWGKKAKRKVNTKDVAKRRAANKAAKAARKRNRR